MGDLLPTYPVYVPSKGRYDTCLTVDFLLRDGVPFHLVIERQEYNEYADRYGTDCLLTLPFRNQGLIAARNWIKDHAIKAGHARHWQIDDNIRRVVRMYKGKRIPCASGAALHFTEEFVDRYKNVALAGLAYEMFGLIHGTVGSPPPFFLNVHVYSCTLVLNNIPHRWRQRYNDDTDLCLQVLADGWCTVLMNAFMVHKSRTMDVKGGNTPIYQGDGRLEMARSLERVWPGVVTTKRRFQRPQHVVKDAWKRFDTPLEYRDDFNPDDLDPDKYRMTLKQVKPIQSPALRQLYEDYNDAPAE